MSTSPLSSVNVKSIYLLPITADLFDHLLHPPPSSKRHDLPSSHASSHGGQEIYPIPSQMALVAAADSAATPPFLTPHESMGPLTGPTTTEQCDVLGEALAAVLKPFKGIHQRPMKKGVVVLNETDSMALLRRIPRRVKRGERFFDHPLNPPPSSKRHDAPSSHASSHGRPSTRTKHRKKLRKTAAARKKAMMASRIEKARAQ